MSAIVLEAIAAELATLVRLVPTPEAPYGYGRDLSCVDDITETLEEVDPDSPLGVAQAVVRRLTTTKGTLPDEPDYGLNLRDFLNAGVPASDLPSLAGQIKLEVLKDDRVENALVTVSLPDTRSLGVTIQLTLYDPALQPFTLTLALTDSATLLQLEAAP